METYWWTWKAGSVKSSKLRIEKVPTMEEILMDAQEVRPVSVFNIIEL